ncbi:MAG: PD-(D/E)XK nuclease family protein [Acidimicrobiales bacterium]|jgi:RecB family exonuclease
MTRDGDLVTASLAAEVAAAKGADPLAPVTVVAPSVYAALAVRRTLGTQPGPSGRRGVANVECTVVDKLLRRLAAPALAARDLRVAPAPVDLEALRQCAAGTPGWLADLAGHPRGLAAMHDACTELRRCPGPTIDALGGRPGRVGELARLVVAVGSHLRERGFADEVEVARAAVSAAGAPSGAVPALGTLVCLELGTLAPSQRRVLDLLAARPGIRWIPSSPGPASFTEVRDCADPGEEVRAALRSVVSAAEKGTPLWRQAVLHPAGPSYARMVHQELAAADVPTNGPELRRLDRSVAGIALVRLLDLATSDWGREEVMAWLATAPIVGGPDRRRVPASRWDLVSAEAGVVRGTAQWAERLAALRGRTGPDRGDDAEALAGFVAGLVEGTSPPATSWDSLARWAAGLLDRYLADDDGSWPAAEAAAAAQVRGAVLALGELDRVSGSADLASFRRTVRTVLEETPLDGSDIPEGGFGDGVFVAPLGRARGLVFDGAVVLGMADALVPGAVGDDALLPEDVRRLDASGGLRTRAARLEELRTDLVAAVATGATRRVATYPRVDPRTGREQMPSRWLERLTTPATRWRPVASFAATVAAADPPLSVRELELHDISRWAAAGRDPSLAPVASCSARLATGITAARQRAGDAFSRFDGNVGRGSVSPFSAETPVSATRLEAYAKCPRRFLYDRILNVRERTLPEDLWQMEPAERGTLVHEVLEAYLLERLAGAPRSLERLLAVAEEHFEAAGRGGLVGKALLWRMDRAAMRRDLARFHHEEGDLEPLAAELEFGDGAEGALPAVAVELGEGRTVRFKGKADRVDRAPGGELVVSDYKTGRQTMLADLRKDPVAGGRLLQLPVYAMAAQARFGDEAPVLARYWLLSEQRVAPCYNLPLTDAVQARFREVLGLIADAVEAGAFPGAPTEKPGERQFDSCRTCDFDVVCPSTRDREWARKNADPALAPVVALMNTTVPDDLAGAVVGRFPGT